MSDIDTGASRSMHDMFWREIAVQDESGGGADTSTAECGQGEDKR